LRQQETEAWSPSEGSLSKKVLELSAEISSRMHLFQISTGQILLPIVESAVQYGPTQGDFQRAIAVLDQVEHALRLPWWQRSLYRLYSILISALAVSCISAIIIIVSFWLGVRPSTDLSGLLLVGSAIIALLALLGALFFIPLNLPLLFKVHKQKRRLRALGMTDAWIGFVPPQTGRRKWGAILRKIALSSGTLLILVGLLTAGASRSVFYLLFFGGIGLVLVLFYFLQEGKVWLDILASRFDEIGQLKTEFTNLSKQEGGSVAVPRRLIEKFSQVQTDQILIGRANAIAESAQSSKELFSVLTSRKVLEEKGRLDIESRLKVEDAIEELMQKPRSETTKTDSVTGSLSCSVEGTNLEIVYTMDEKARRLQLVDLRQASAGGVHA